MANDEVCATGAATRDVSSAPASSQQDCSDVVHISVFFDGTGNNKNVDEASKKWSNPARIWRSAQMLATPGSSNYAVYIAGVGTPFNGKALTAADAAAIAIEDSALLGQAAGAGGSRRLGFGHQQINDALRSALLARAKTLGGQVAQYAEAGKSKSFADVNRALGPHRLIKQINVSIFGFSRGAALARAFCNQWLWRCENNRGELLYEKYPIRFVFLGLFDTVASFGLPATNMANSGFNGRDLVVDDRVERCVHYVAGHELRFAFPVDLIRRDGKLSGPWLEKTYPGVHSDVGGGYEPMDQDIDNNYARIPMRDMMREGGLHGVRLMSYGDLAKDQSYRALFQERFECKLQTKKAYNAYVAACNPGGSIEQQMQKHMEHLYSAYGTLQRQDGESVTQRQHRQGKSWRLGPDDMATEIKSYEAALKALQAKQSKLQKALDPTYKLRKGAHALWISPKAWQMEAWKRNAGDGVMDFVHSFVHDSKVGFMSNAEPFSYFSQRGVSESNRSVRGWLEANVARPVDGAIESSADYAEEKAEQVSKAAAEKAEQVKKAAIEKAEQAKRAAAEAAKKAKETAIETAEKAKRAAAEVAQKAKEVASETAQQARRTAAEIGDKAQRGAEAVGQAAGRAGDAISKGTQQVIDGLGRAWEKFGW